MMVMFTAFVPGTPAPQGSKRAWVDKKTGRVMMAEQSTRVGPWRTAVKRAFKPLAETTIVTPVRVDVTFRFRRPKTVKREFPTGNEGDVDKLLRSTYDGLVMSGVLADDSLVVSGAQDKKYAEPWEEPGALITVRTV